MSEPKTVVVFRKFRKGGDIIALFPELSGTRQYWTCSSYQRVGQHGAADYHGCIKATVPASPEEYAELAEELRRIGYDLDIRQRATAAMQFKRQEELRQ